MASLPQQHLRNNRPQSTIPRWLPNTGARPYLVGTPVYRSPKVAQASFISLPHETEDSRITGGTRSLTRRLLALNVEGSLSARKVGGMSTVRTTAGAKTA